ncbi:MAG: 3-phosphoshikimate 1-carboxyvinyltransferase [Eudoraea sp.]|nr:3-phosphoshikimate 1-carboxyvinyltransferase [Eudoraea sp.]
MAVRVAIKSKVIQGKIQLAGSKSISNRVLIIRALSGEDFPIEGLASSHDTKLMTELLRQKEGIFDAGPAGTTFRFLTAYLSMQPGSQVLTGSERMKQRPIKILVEALNQLGANIEYLENEGYPPLKINAPTRFAESGKISLPANISSQYISALLMIAPSLPNGLEITLEGEIVSIPYIQMTLNIMAYCGVDHIWEGNVIRISNQKYQPRPFTVEADWSAASYYYAIAALADEANLELHGLFQESTQGDAAISQIMDELGVKTTFGEGFIKISKNGGPLEHIEYDFIKCPDLAQTVVSCCAGLGTRGLFTGLQTLRIKETDRIAALRAELGKGQSYFSQLPKRFSPKSDKEYHMIEGKFHGDETRIKTYEDHRMAMALAPLSLITPLIIEEESVVNKSYPEFWEDLRSLGFEVEEVG